MLSYILKQVEKKKNEHWRAVRQVNRDMVERRREHFRGIGVEEEILLFMPSQPEDHMPTPVQQRLDEASAANARRQ